MIECEAIDFQAWIRGILSRRRTHLQITELQQRVLENRFSLAAQDVDWTRPIIDRVREYLPLLLSTSLYHRKRAAYIISKSFDIDLFPVSHFQVALLYGRERVASMLSRTMVCRFYLIHSTNAIVVLVVSKLLNHLSAYLQHSQRYIRYLVNYYIHMYLCFFSVQMCVPVLLWK